jgi:hypothetical protein
MDEKFIKKQLDYDGWIAYKKGSSNFKKAVELGLILQFYLMNVLLKKLDDKFK